MTAERGGGPDPAALPLEVWIQGRDPRAPAVFLPMLLEGEEGTADPASLAAKGLGFLDQALAAPGRNRRAAFDLLVGDAFLTYACEALSSREDPEEGLRELLRLVGERLAT